MADMLWDLDEAAAEEEAWCPFGLEIGNVDPMVAAITILLRISLVSVVAPVVLEPPLWQTRPSHLTMNNTIQAMGWDLHQAQEHLDMDRSEGLLVDSDLEDLADINLVPRQASMLFLLALAHLRVHTHLWAMDMDQDSQVGRSTADLPKQHSAQ
ncbi:MAG: hypothetical protein Q9163_005152 [Psora crenata]